MTDSIFVTTLCGVMPRMHRMASFSHTVRPQLKHGVFSYKTFSSLPNGNHIPGKLRAENTVTTLAPAAAARWAGPLS
jgi:hypothetical protein